MRIRITACLGGISMLDKPTVRQIAQRYAEKVSKELAPKSIILFGSYANGNPHLYSDIDIAVVFNDYKDDWLDTAAFLQRLRRGIDDDTLGGIEPHLFDEASDHSGFLAHIVEVGEVLYQS